MKNVAVFLSANDLANTYTKPAKELGKLLAKNDFGFVYGGSDRGLMKVMSAAVQKAGGKVIGITMEMLKDSRKKDADEMIIAPTLAKRKKIMNERSEAIIVMVGGIGTLDEVLELLELKKHGMHNKPIIFLNTNNFYRGLKMQFMRMEKEGFLPKKLDEMVSFADSPEEVIKFLHKELAS